MSRAEKLIVEFIVTDGLQIGGRLMPKQSTNSWWYAVPVQWALKKDFYAEFSEFAFQGLYGENWRRGNADGSRYVVVRAELRIPFRYEIERAVWRKAASGCFEADASGRVESIDAQDLAAESNGRYREFPEWPLWNQPDDHETLIAFVRAGDIDAAANHLMEHHHVDRDGAIDKLSRL